MNTTRRACFSAIASAAMLLCAAQAQALNFDFSQKFDIGGFNGTVGGSFSAVDTNTDGFFQASEMTFLSLTYSGTTPASGLVNLSYAPPNILVVGATEWFASGSDKTLGEAGNGFFLAGQSLTGIQMTWAAGPVNGFDYGNNPGSNSGGDPQNSNVGCPGGSNFPLCRFGQIDLFSSANAPLGSAKSNDYATIIPSPIPEPATYLMMLGGIAALALGARRRAA